MMEEIKSQVKKYFDEQNTQKKFELGKTRIPLNVPSYGWEEAYEAIESILTTWVTMGKKVKAFERLFADYIGVKHAIMVNSGSSANLLALSVLANPALKGHIQPGDEIITPAVTWATTVFPIFNIGAVPVLVDVDLETFNIDADKIEAAITKKTKTIMPVHLLGNPCAVEKIMQIAKKHNLFVIEDTCEAHGALYNGRKAGSFSDMGTFSFFFTHHISTIEGGMIVTDNDEYAELCRAMRVFGWIRDLANKDELAKKYANIDSRFLFVNAGFNFRPTEMQGGFGIHQMKKLEDFIQIRRVNADFWTKQLEKYSDSLILPHELPGTRHVWFGYPITVKPEAGFTRSDLVKFLESKGLETRPIMAGNIEEQPAMRMFKYRKSGDLKNAKFISTNSFFFGNHQGIGEEERNAVVKYFNEFMSRR